MKWVLVVLICHTTGAFSNICDTKEVAVFPDRGTCEQAAARYYPADRPICGIKEYAAKGREGDARHFDVR